MRDIGLIQFWRDEVLLRRKSVSILIYGEAGLGKTMAGAVPLAMKLDPTFLKNVEERYIVGDQYEKLAHYYNLPNEYTRGKAFIWDEIGVGAYAENHSEKVVKWLARAGQISRIKYAFFIATTTSAKLVTSNVRNEFTYIMRAINKDAEHNKTIFKIWKNVQIVHQVGFGEQKIEYRLRLIRLPREYRQNTSSAEYAETTIRTYSLRLPPYEKIKKVYELEERWKNSFNKKSAEEMLKATSSTSRSESIYSTIARKIVANYDEFSKGTRVKKLDREKIFNSFNLTTNAEFNKIKAFVERERIAKGYAINSGDGGFGAGNSGAGETDTGEDSGGV